MLARGNKEGPLFLWQNVHFLIREGFVQPVREALTVSGLEALDYAGHSFCIGLLQRQHNVSCQSQLSGRW